jgi:hypothetical protein
MRKVKKEADREEREAWMKKAKTARSKAFMLPATTKSGTDPRASRPETSRSGGFRGPVITITNTSDGQEVKVDSEVPVTLRFPGTRSR